MPKVLPIVLTQICLLICNVAFAQLPGFFMKETARKIEVRFINSNNLIIVPVSVNGNPPLNFILDTGVRTNILFSKSLGDQMNLNYTRSLDLIGADGKTVLTASISPNNYIDLGKIEGISQTILVLDEDFFELESVIGLPVYGVIGYEFFKFNPIKVDYDRGKITFYEASALKWRPFGFRKLTMNIEMNKPYVYAKIRQSEGPILQSKLLIDTGANHGLLLNPETSEDIVVPLANLEADLGRSLGGDLFGVIARAKYISMKGLRFSNILASYPEETDYSYIIKESGRQGSLGSELLGRLEIILDYPRERFMFRKASTFMNPHEYDMSGITTKVLLTDERRIYISKIRSNSPAANIGLKEKDEIIKINNIPIDFWELSDIIKFFKSEVGKTINLTINRYESENVGEVEVKEFQFRLRRQI
ncbi:aspartyl protease family protein [Belliella sp. R4-6]|uniref:Aspartyl protease family protein n=1 Tax=Belliella alkalica TaxID=1730871 RepID=A0ABS9V9M9_9BACT|nr:aspartyl protease family protein [Belliella alkalica]MCH7413131.1 aspartyl protease family protein [Belliella alkalica]